MKKKSCGIFISDEGFGHMVRQRAIIQELLKISFNKNYSFYLRIFSFLRNILKIRLNTIKFHRTCSQSKIMMAH